MMIRIGGTMISVWVIISILTCHRIPQGIWHVWMGLCRLGARVGVEVEVEVEVEVKVMSGLKCERYWNQDTLGALVAHVMQQR